MSLSTPIAVTTSPRPVRVAGPAHTELIGLLAAARRLDTVGGWCYAHGHNALLVAVIRMVGGSIRDGLDMLPYACGCYCPVTPGGVYS